MGVASDDSTAGLFSFPKNLSLWWSEETDSVLQRFERWAAYARGYNRLRSARLSAGRMTMHEEPDCNRWSINRTTNRLQVDGGRWAPSFRQHRAAAAAAAAAERSKLRCCANLGYKSNGNLESNCLEAYSMDHSIYFKTIGEVRSEKRSNNSSSSSSSSSNNNDESTMTLKSPPIDCGDFLASDFDEMDSDDDGLEELDDADYVLREQLDQLAAACDADDDDDEEDEDCACEDSNMRGVRMGEIQLCRSLINEDEINNNVMMMTGLMRKAQHVQLRQLPTLKAQ